MRRRTFLHGSAMAGVGLAGVGATTAAAASAEDRGPNRPLRVQVVLFEGVILLDAVPAHDVLSVAGRVGSRPTRVGYVRVDGPGTVRAADGTRVEVANGWAPERADVIVVPGSGPSTDGPGVPAEIARGVLPKALAAARRPGLTLTSVCTGALLLGAAGLVRGRPCVTHHSALAQLEAQGGVIKKARVVDDGDLVTAGGITSGLDLALWLVRRELDPDSALAVETVLEYEAHGTVWTATA